MKILIYSVACSHLTRKPSSSLIKLVTLFYAHGNDLLFYLPFLLYLYVKISKIIWDKIIHALNEEKYVSLKCIIFSAYRVPRVPVDTKIF